MPPSTSKVMMVVQDCLVLVFPLLEEYLQELCIRVVKSTTKKRLGSQKRRQLRKLSSRNRKG